MSSGIFASESVIFLFCEHYHGISNLVNCNLKEFCLDKPDHFTSVFMFPPF